MALALTHFGNFFVYLALSLTLSDWQVFLKTEQYQLLVRMKNSENAFILL
jgi:hypothetical protein